jgi:hypothetical protein
MGTSFWKDAIEREMKDGLPVFKFWWDDYMPVGSKKIYCHGLRCEVGFGT